MTSQVKKFYKGDLYTLTTRQGEMISAQYEDGYKVFDPALLDALQKVWKFH